LEKSSLNLKCDIITYQKHTKVHGKIVLSSLNIQKLSKGTKLINAQNLLKNDSINKVINALD